MAMNHSANEGPHSAASEKKPYEKPGFRHERVFVTSALTCNKLGDQSQCMLNPPTKTS